MNQYLSHAAKHFLTLVRYKPLKSTFYIEPSLPMNLLPYYVSELLKHIAENTKGDSGFEKCRETPEYLYTSYSYTCLFEVLNKIVHRSEEINVFAQTKVPAIERYLEKDKFRLTVFEDRKALIKDYLDEFNSMKYRWECKLTNSRVGGVTAARFLTEELLQEALDSYQSVYKVFIFSIVELRKILAEMERKNIESEFKDFTARLRMKTSPQKENTVKPTSEQPPVHSGYTVVCHSPISILEARLTAAFGSPESPNRLLLRHPIEGVAIARRIQKSTAHLSALTTRYEHVETVVEYITAHTMTPEFQREFNKHLSFQGVYNPNTIEAFCDDIINFCTGLYPFQFQIMHWVICCHADYEKYFPEEDVEATIEKLKRQGTHNSVIKFMLNKMEQKEKNTLLLAWSKLYYPDAGCNPFSQHYLFDLGMFKLKSFIENKSASNSIEPPCNSNELPGDISKIYPFSKGAAHSPIPDNKTVKFKMRLVRKAIPANPLPAPKDIKAKAKKYALLNPGLKKILAQTPCSEQYTRCQCVTHKNYRKALARLIEMAVRVFTADPKAVLNERTPVVVCSQDFESIDDLKVYGDNIAYVRLV